jgi:zinc protease
VALRYASLVLLASLGGCRSIGGAGGAAGTAASPVEMGGPTTQAASRLDNGVTVVVEENHAAPVVAVQVWVAAGAADDPPALAGAASLCERLVFRGTHRRGPGAAAREIEAAGGTLGGWTGLEETVYHLALAAPSLELGLDVLADALTGPTFNPVEVAEERRLALGEIARAETSTSRAGAEALRAAAFPSEVYGRPLLGTAAAVAALTPAALAARFAETYVGANLTVVVVGDVDTRVARAAVARAFAIVPRGAAVRRPASVAPTAPRARVVLSKGPAVAPELLVGFRTPPASAEDAAAIDLLAALLARDDDARLARGVMRNLALADAVSGYTFVCHGGALLALAVSPRPRRLEAAARAAVDETLRLAREEVPADELERARLGLEGDLARGEDGVEGHARRLGFGAAIAGDLGYEGRYRERLARISPAQLREVAAQLFRPDAITLAVIEPAAGSGRSDAGASGRLEAMIADADGRADRQQAPPAPPELSGDLARVVTPSGARIVVLRDVTAPLVAIEAAWAGGARVEDAGSNGAAAFIAALLDRGTRTRSPGQIAAEVRGMGGSLSGFADRNHLALRAQVLPGAWARGLALVADCVLNPSFPGEEVDAQRRVLLDRARVAEDDQAHLARQLFREALWPGHPFRLDPLGSTESIASLTRVRLLDHYRRRYPESRLVISVVGDVEPGRVVATLSALFAKTAAGAPAGLAADAPADRLLVLAGAPPPQPPEPAHAEPVTVFRTTDKDVAEIVLGFPGAAAGDPDRLALEALAVALAADGGRIGRALQGHPPLAYRVGVSVARGFDPGYFAIELSCAPARVDAAVAAVRAALAEVAAAGLTGDEVARATRLRAGAQALTLRGQAAIADALALDEAYGLAAMSYRQVPAAMSRITTADVARAARRFIDPKREVIAVVRRQDPAPLARTAGRGR